MKRKIFIGLAVVLLLAMAVPAFAALTTTAQKTLTDAQKKEILSLEKQIIELRKKIVDKYVEAGQLTEDQGKLIKERMDQMQKFREENGILPGPGGFGGGPCKRGGFGRGGFGPGFGPGGGWNGVNPGTGNNSNNTNNTTNTSSQGV